MKLILIIPFLFILLLQSLHVSLEDLVKIPELVEHYQEHRTAHGDGVLSFIKKHYGSEKEDHKSEDSDHEDLPFNHSQHLCLDIRMDVPPNFTLEAIHVDQSNHFFVYHEPHTSKRTYKIHQPPKNNC